MNILITGGTGFIGSRLALKCVSMGYRVQVLGQKSKPGENDNGLILENSGVKVIYFLRFF